MDIAHNMNSTLRVSGISEKDFHIIEYAGSYFLLHIPDSMLFEIDDLARDRILSLTVKKGKIDRKILSKYSKKEIAQIDRELKGLLKPKRSRKRQIKSIDTISLNIARSCNLRCKYCYTIDGSYGLGDCFMEEQTAYKAIEYFLKGKRKGSFHIHFFGGEPLLNFDLIKKVVEFTKKIKRKRNINFSYSLVTNGTLFDKRIVRFLKSNKFGLTVSIDGERKFHDRNRIYKNGKGSYSDVVKGIKLIGSSKGLSDFTCRVTVVGNSIDFVKTFKNLKKMGFNKIHFSPASITRNSSRDSKTNWKVMEKGIDALFKEAMLNIGKGKENLQSYSNFAYTLEMLAGRQTVIHPCSAGRSYLVVDADSRFYLCHRFTGMKDFSLGNLGRKGFSTKQKWTVDKNEICRGCWARYLCGGGCYYENYVSAGNVKRQIDEYCRYIKGLIERTVLLYIECRRKKILHKVFNWFDRPYKEKT